MLRMIARLWRGVASTGVNADAYQRHVTMRVFPALAAIQVRRFAGDDAEAAVVEPEARAVLSDYDNLVRHYEVYESH